jgi:hypothetical protein
MAATITYNWPPGNGTVPPTVAQAALVNIQTVQVAFGADSDTTATITHNWASPASTAQGVGLITPMVSVDETSTTSPVAVSVTLTNSLTCTLTKLSAAGSVGTWTVVLSR